ncbi:MAG TPA: glucosaminidase domain-containing protein [Chitinophagaceae bacterium]|nr:glucosaminidase domain-containing protein [Chitinophagaceae bacterium]
MKRYILLLTLMLSTVSFGQNVEAVRNYVNMYKELAMEEMQRTGVPASITLAQGIHESGAGMSELALSSNNHFGIKCKSNWTGESVKHDDDARGECFRKYPSAEDSYKDHSDFLKNSQRYASLFTLDPADYEGWANGLKKAGYATNPKYPQVLIKLIVDYQLQDYTMIALGKMPFEERATPVVSIANVEPFIKKEEVVTQPVYPEGEFKINETKVVYVKKGTSFLAIAKQYDIDLSKIFEFNEILQAEETSMDQLVYLQRKRKTGDNGYHTVLPGETLHDIAQQEAIRLESLLELNQLEAGMQPAAGEQLSLQNKSVTKPRLVLKENYTIIPAAKNKNTN